MESELVSGGKKHKPENMLLLLWKESVPSLTCLAHASPRGAEARPGLDPPELMLGYDPPPLSPQLRDLPASSPRLILLQPRASTA